MEIASARASMRATSVTRFSHICAVIKTKLDHSKFKLSVFLHKLIAQILKISSLKNIKVF